ncbi:hypothetical protein POVCU2_0042660 [Plasmodium ovale curtisi]|uniref:Uncharacterized protein n=1 Tax=Plasmodium ovale curtisi TaxID=864141 RepID=A0A1A8W6X6_PLAOA|nr:hypothetical protein POVCU2_0042660 [Plasmodium ovale curtisi]
MLSDKKVSSPWKQQKITYGERRTKGNRKGVFHCSCYSFPFSLYQVAAKEICKSHTSHDAEENIHIEGKRVRLTNGPTTRGVSGSPFSHPTFVCNETPSLYLLSLCVRVANVTPVSRTARLIIAYHGNRKHQKFLEASIRNVNRGYNETTRRTRL